MPSLTLRPGVAQEVLAGSDGSTFTNYGPATVSYSDSPTAGESPEGSLEADESATLYGQVWLFAESRADVAYVPAVPDESAALEDVRPYTVQADWSDFDQGAGWWVDAQGQIHCRGVLLYDGGGNNNNPIDFPVGFQPETINVWGTVTGQSQTTDALATWLFTIGADGQMFVVANPAVAGGGLVPSNWALYMNSIVPFRVDQ